MAEDLALENNVLLYFQVDSDKRVFFETDVDGGGNIIGLMVPWWLRNVVVNCLLAAARERNHFIFCVFLLGHSHSLVY